MLYYCDQQILTLLIKSAASILLSFEQYLPILFPQTALNKL